ncbi:ABC transporter substrate-binding protein [Georgenia alba]|uniref:ABC transporter substrate-binding protein n=1 Tax=Georgenia alba TaxID=2233858 RepID=A0ABW2Q805_9MICO
MARWTTTARRRRPVLAAASAAALLALTACGGGFSEQQAEDQGDQGQGGGGGETLVIGTINPPASFDPINQTDVGGQWANQFVLDTLLNQPEPLEFTPELAEEFGTEDNQTFTFTLNPDATWSDGEPITAEDVVFTLNLIAHPESLTSRGANISTLTGVDGATGKLPDGETEIPGLVAVDEQTVQFETKAPVDPNYIYEMIGSTIPVLPEHHLADVPPADFGESEFAQLPDVTSGAYTYTSYTDDVSIEYAANEDYYRGAPQIPSIAMRIMPAANLAGDLQAGAIHMNSGGGIGNIPVQDMPTVEGLENVTTSIDPTIGFQTMMFNLQTVEDVNVRQAIAHAVNREQIVDQLLRGNGEIIDGPYTSQSPYLDEGLETTQYDPDRARELLEETDFDENTTLRFVVPTGNAIREQSADIILQNLQDVGFTVEQSNFDFPTVQGMAQNGEFDLLLMGYTFNVDPDMSALYSSQGQYNYMGYENPRVDELLDQGKAEPDPEARQEIYAELQRIWQEDMPILTTYSDHATSVVSNELEVGGAAPFWPGTLTDLPEWHFGTQ